MADNIFTFNRVPKIELFFEEYDVSLTKTYGQRIKQDTKLKEDMNLDPAE
jgi:hypothetical protein